MNSKRRILSFLCTVSIVIIFSAELHAMDGTQSSDGSTQRSVGDLLKYLYPDSFTCHGISFRHPVIKAITTGSLSVLQQKREFVIAMGQDRDRLKPLHIAVAYGKLDIVKWLVNECNVNVNDDDNELKSTPLHVLSQVAADSCDENKADKKVEIAKILVDRGAKPDMLDSTGATPLFHAAHGGDEDLISFFIDHECDILVSVPAANGKSQSIVELLLENRVSTPDGKKQLEKDLASAEKAYMESQQEETIERVFATPSIGVMIMRRKDGSFKVIMEDRTGGH